MKNTLQKAIRKLIVCPILLLTGFRFSKDHRWNETWQYRLFNTTLANIETDAKIIAQYGMIK